MKGVRERSWIVPLRQSRVYKRILGVTLNKSNTRIL